MNAVPLPRSPVAWQRWAPLLLLATAWPAIAQYKVIGPDGKVTYTDRAPTPAEGKVSAMNARGGSASVDVALPIELRQAATRYPVSLYTTAGCDPCEAARTMLRQRGIPFAEKQIVAADDAEALERLSGGRDTPTLAIGTQMLRGLAPEVWGSYLDAAGYPRESHLPSSYQYPAATPMIERQAAARPQPVAVPAPAIAPPPAPGTAGIKF